MDLKKYMNEYIESKEMAWAPTTLKSEGARLSAVAEALDGDPGHLWKHMLNTNMAPYSRVTTWVRVVHFWSYLQSKGVVKSNPYKVFKDENARLFKNAYKHSKPEMTYEEAIKRIESLEDPAIKRRALEIIGSGARWSESESHSGNSVVGKGSKERAIYVPKINGPDFIATYQTFRRSLATVGLKPHDLRKLFLSRLVEMGANEFELMEAAGWATLGPAKAYINVNKESLKAKVKKLQGEE